MLPPLDVINKKRSKSFNLLLNKYIRLLVEGFVLNDEESEMIFIEELVNTGTDYCFFRSIGLDGDEA